MSEQPLSGLEATAEDTLALADTLMSQARIVLELVEGEFYTAEIAQLLKNKREELDGDDLGPFYLHMQSNPGKLILQRKLKAIKAQLSSIESLVGE